MRWFVGSLAAFAFSRFQFAGKRLFLLVFLLSQMLPGASVIIPLFQFLNAMGLYDTHAGLILVHSAVLLPFVIWLLYGFFQGIPREVEDAALIDGCSRLTALRKVILPLALPGIGATALFAFLGSWNEFFFALDTHLIGCDQDHSRRDRSFRRRIPRDLEPDGGIGGPVQPAAAAALRADAEDVCQRAAGGRGEIALAGSSPLRMWIPEYSLCRQADQEGSGDVDVTGLAVAWNESHGGDRWIEPALS